MEILCASGSPDGVELYLDPSQLGESSQIPLGVRVIHLGDLRSPDVGDLTKRLGARVDELYKLCNRSSGIAGVVVHAESALGWGRWVS